MGAAMARFATVVAATVDEHDGVLPVEQGEGDSFVAAFARGSDALACALALQREWSNASWPFSVRMALHSGEVQVRGTSSYEGPTVIRCARLRSIAHGGQIVLSEATRDLIVDSMPVDAWLDDAGVHRLKDLDRAEHVYQLRHPDLPVVDRPLASNEPMQPALPAQLSSFIGREREIAAVDALLQTNRMVTLLGAGGTGKTRLALEVAGRAAERFPDGVWFVDLTVAEDGDLA